MILAIHYGIDTLRFFCNNCSTLLRKGFDMTFKQQVVIALLNGDMEKWMARFDDYETAAKYAGCEVPTDTLEAVKLQQQVVAVQVAETADAIVKAVA
jgi:hypothetical protein